MSKDPILLIDAHNAIHRAYHVMKDLQTSTGESIGALYGFSKILKSEIEKYSGYIPIVVWDSKSARKLMVSNNSYKEHRKTDVLDPKTATIISNISAAKELVKILGIPSIQVPRVEADDIIGHLARLNAEGGSEFNNVVISSTDKDYYQLLHLDGVMIDRPLRETEILTKYDFRSKKGVTPLGYRLSHILLGDPGDGVPGIPGLGPTTVYKFVNSIPPSILYPLDLDNILQLVESSNDSRLKLVLDYEIQVRRNFYLVDLLEVELLGAVGSKIVSSHLSRSGGIDSRQFHEFTRRYEFDSLGGDQMSRYLRTFERAVKCTDRIWV
jgi:5'-3' exonuclease